MLEHVEGGELYDYVSTNGALPEIEAVLYFRQILSALACCHRFNICHRDLKPENILFDENRNIKLADFGMAALQPDGHWLNTSCGSPHYASPEIVYGHRYKGDKADVWSCGIILFAMLTGFLPFDGGDLKTTLNLVKKGEYILPHWLSREAADLIQRILQTSPEDRLTIPEILEHPLLVKYEMHPRFVNVSHAESDSPPLAKYSFSCVTRRQDIDMEIVRSLRTLWHEVTVQQLIDNILNDRANHEKLFYKALLKFRDEQFGNYDAQPLGYSSSDHHHMSRPFLSIAQRRLQANSGASGAAVVPNISVSVPVGEPVLKETVAGEEPRSARTAASYDPYRSSNTPLHNPQADFANVTVHRQASNPIINTDSQPPGSNDFCQGSEDEPRGKSQNFLQPDPRSSAACSGSFRRSSLVSFQSHSSIGSSRRQKLRSSSVPRSTGYKRNVSFRHLRHAKGNAALRNGVQQTCSQYSLCRDSTPELQAKKVKRMSSSPSLPTPPPPVRTRKDHGKASELNIAKPRQSYQQWKDDARKVSLELGQICEEAFNRSSVSSSTPTTGQSSSRETSESPPTSVSAPEIQANADCDTQTAEDKAAEDKAGESPTSYASRELAETRRRLVDHSNVASADGMSGYLSDVIAHLDRLLATEASAYTNRNKKAEGTVPCAPTTRPGLPSLPPINEESDTATGTLDTGDSHFRPSKLEDGPSRRRNTIRVVSPDQSSTHNNLRPLSVRKKTNVLPTLPEHPTDFLSGTLLENSNFEEINTPSPITKRTSRYYAGLDATGDYDDDKSPRSSEVRSSGETRKWSWFKHRPHRDDNEPTPPTTPSKDNIGKRRATASVSQGGADKIPKPLPTEAENTSKAKAPADRGGKFLRFFGRKKIREGKPAHEIARGSKSCFAVYSFIGNQPYAKHNQVNDPDETMASIDSAARNDLFDSGEYDHDHNSSARRVSQNWLARFFHVKPASKVLALNVPKGRAKKEVTKILREWKKYGMEGVRLDKKTKVLKARVGELNCRFKFSFHISASCYIQANEHISNEHSPTTSPC